jgi:hypothetical protein
MSFDNQKGVRIRIDGTPFESNCTMCVGFLGRTHVLRLDVDGTS